MLRTILAAALLCSFTLAGCADPDDSDLQDIGGGTTTEDPWTGSTGTATGTATNGTTSSTMTTTASTMTTTYAR